MNKNLEKLNQILELIRHNTVTPKDLREFLVLMLETIKKSKQNFDDLSKENLEIIAESIAYIKNEGETNLKTLDEKSTKTLKKIEDKLGTISTLIEEVRAMKWEKPRDGIDGEPGAPGKDGSPDTGEDIVDKINALPVNEANQIDASHIKNLPEAKGGKGGSTARNLWQLHDYPLTTKGDILTYDTGAARLGVGEDGQILVADSSEDVGMRWEDPSFLANTTYMFSGTASGVGSYYQMPALGTWVESTEASIVTAGVSTTPTLIASFITDAGSPGVTTIPAGTYHFHIETEKTAGSNNYYVYTELYKRTAGGTETLILTSDNSTETAVNTRVQRDVDGLLSASETLNVTDRLVVKWYAVMLSSTATITTYWDNNTEARMEMPAVVVDASNFVRKSGDTMSGDLDMDGNSIANASLITGNKASFGTTFSIGPAFDLEIGSEITTGGASGFIASKYSEIDVAPDTDQNDSASAYNVADYSWLKAPASNTNDIAVLAGMGTDVDVASSNIRLNSVYGAYANVYFTGSTNTVTNEVGGAWFSATLDFPVTVPDLYGSWYGATAQGTATSVTNMHGAWFYTNIAGDSVAVTNAYGARIQMLKSGSSTVTNRYGIYLETPTGSATNDYGIYQAGTQFNYLGGAFLDTGFALVDNADTTKKAVFQCSSIGTGTTRTYTLPNTSATIVVNSGNQTIYGTTSFQSVTDGNSNARVFYTGSTGGGAEIRGHNGFSATLPIYSFWYNNYTGLGNPAFNVLSFIVNAVELGRFSGSNFTVTNGIELGHASDTTISRLSAGVVGVEGIEVPTVSSTSTLTNKTVTDSTFYIQDESDNTKKCQFQASNITTGTTRTLTLPDASVVLAGVSNPQTFTNKRITKRVGSTTSSATPTINTDDYDCYKITALATAITSFTTNLSGTPTDFQELTIRIKDDGTARAITWGASFTNHGAILPTTTTVSKTLTVKFIYDSVAAIWGCVSAVEEA